MLSNETALARIARYEREANEHAIKATDHARKSNELRMKAAKMRKDLDKRA